MHDLKQNTATKHFTLGVGQYFFHNNDDVHNISTGQTPVIVVYENEKNIYPEKSKINIFKQKSVALIFLNFTLFQSVVSEN